MAFQEHYHQVRQSPPLPYTSMYSQSQPIGRADIQHTAMDRFEEQWRSSQGRAVSMEVPKSSPRDHPRAHGPPRQSSNAPFYVPRTYEMPISHLQDRQGMDAPVHQDPLFVQVNQAPRRMDTQPAEAYPAWQRDPDMDRLYNLETPPSHYRSFYAAPRSATVPPPQYQQSYPRYERSEARSRRNAYAEARRGRRSTSSQPRHIQRRKFPPPRHYQRHLPNRTSVR